jgi:hypothetical protein
MKSEAQVARVSCSLPLRIHDLNMALMMAAVLQLEGRIVVFIHCLAMMQPYYELIELNLLRCPVMAQR